MFGTGMKYQVCYEVNRNKNFERTRCTIDPRNFTGVTEIFMIYKLEKSYCFFSRRRGPLLKRQVNMAFSSRSNVATHKFLHAECERRPKKAFKLFANFYLD